MTRRSTIRIAACALALLAPAGAARAQTALTIDNFGPGGQRELESLDLATGELTPIGPFTLPPDLFGVQAITFLRTGELVGVDDLCGVLLQIDPATGQTTVVASLGIQHPQQLRTVGLAADACGGLWLTCEETGAPFGSFLYRIDPATGAAELRGTLPEPIGGLAAAGGLLYGLQFQFFPGARLLSLDPQTLEMSEVAVVEDLFAWATYALDVGPGGELIALGRFVPLFPTPTPEMVVGLNLAGEVTSPPVALEADEVQGLAVAPPAGECLAGAVAIPAVSSLGLAALAVILAAAGAAVLLRRS